MTCRRAARRASKGDPRAHLTPWGDFPRWLRGGRLWGIVRSFALPLLVSLGSACASPTSAVRSPPAKAAQPAGFALPFIEDDWPRATAEAKRIGKPIFVDVWAPWCHTCLSLRAYVLRDPRLAPLADRFVWATIDTEKESNAAFVAAHPIEAWPTLFVIDAATDVPTLKWLGAATTPELILLLGDAADAMDGSGGKKPGAAEASAHFIKGSRASASGDLDGAIAEYREALARTVDPIRRARVVDALITQLAKKDPAGCAKLALDEAPKLPKGTSRANVAVVGLQCARTAKDDAAGKTLFDLVRAMAADESEPILADDRSGLYETLVEDRKDAGDIPAAQALARAWATFLEKEAARATDPASRSVFDAHRMLAYLELGEPGRALPMLTQTAKDFPSDYNAPARLAKVYLVMGRLDDAKAAIELSLTKAYGPRRLRLLVLKADIAKAHGDKGGERAALETALKEGKALTLEGGYAKLLKQIESRLGAL